MMTVCAFVFHMQNYVSFAYLYNPQTTAFFFRAR